MVRRVRPLFRRLDDAVEAAQGGTGTRIPICGIMETLDDHGGSA
jgi:hypothetical protein